MAENKQKPAVRFKGFTDAWEQRKLGEIYEVNNERNEGQYPVEKTFSISTMTFNEQGNGADISSLSKYKVLRVGDIAFEGHTNKEFRYGRFVLNNLENGIMSPRFTTMRPIIEQDYNFWEYYIHSEKIMRSRLVNATKAGTMMNELVPEDLFKQMILVPTIGEQKQVGAFFKHLDNLITLHQRKPLYYETEVNNMLKEITQSELFCEYYAKWITVYKRGAIRKVTLDKYLMTQQWLVRLIPDLTMGELDRMAYQQLLNDYALYHERQTTMDFHHQLKGAILDAVDEGLIERDPTRKAIIKGKTPSVKKIKYLNQFELHTLITTLNLKSEINWDYFILLVAKTGMRFSEALALTPKDFDFAHQTLSISKTWDYKGDGGFQPTKNKSSVRKIQIDWQTVIQFSELVKNLPEDKPIFVKTKVYNSTVNEILSRHCKEAKIPVISIHGLRHTHASLLLFAGVSIASVARRLGHSSMTTTQKTYLHIIQELENKDVDLVMRSLSGLN